MEVEDRIRAELQKRGALSGAQIAAALGISRQAAHRHLVRLLGRGALQRTGRTRGVRYTFPGGPEKAPRRPRFRSDYPTRGLEEDVVLAEVTSALDLRRALVPNALRIFSYAFTEILNNAIEHSRSARCSVEVRLDQREVHASIRDQGVGVFSSIARRFKLRDEHDAIAELLKGKATTMPERHSGQGIFFTSKAVDHLELRSHRIELAFDARTGNAVVHVRRPLRGTGVTMGISRATRRRLETVFASFAPEEYDLQFEKTRVLVRLAARDFVSRSEARRLTTRLDQFREVELDFSAVTSLGQAFADELFRVFPAANPRLRLTRTHVAPALEAVIRGVVDNRH